MHKREIDTLALLLDLETMERRTFARWRRSSPVARKVTEVQAGSYVFMDGAYRTVRPDPGRPALTLLTAVISRRGDRAIIDAGMKSLTNEFGPPTGKDLPIKVSRLSEEHGQIDASGTEIDAGVKLEIVPSHNDTTINLHSEYYVMCGDEVVAIWPIEAARAYR